MAELPQSRYTREIAFSLGVLLFVLEAFVMFRIQHSLFIRILAALSIAIIIAANLGKPVQAVVYSGTFNKSRCAGSASNCAQCKKGIWASGRCPFGTPGCYATKCDPGSMVSASCIVHASAACTVAGDVDVTVCRSCEDWFCGCSINKLGVGWECPQLQTLPNPPQTCDCNPNTPSVGTADWDYWPNCT